MKKYDHFVLELNQLKNEYSSINKNEWKKNAVHSINGLASQRLRSLVSLEDRRASGAFFTGSKLALDVIKSYKLNFGREVNFYDPACGASNLLISIKNHYAKKLLKRGIPLKVFGTDIHKEFVKASKLRLEISDLLQNEINDYSNCILVADGLKPNKLYQNATHIITNPPFNLIESPEDIDWASGKVSAAALFIDFIISNVNSGVEIIAILPDVLRSGSRYEKWRTYVSTYCEVSGVKLCGQFDNFADVDVFSVLLKKKVRPSAVTISPWITSVDFALKLADLFEVSVGSVVDNRDPHMGVQRPYVISKGLEGWAELKETELLRRHKGKIVQSPFVVIKRTSRFGDKNRVIATLINMPIPVHVDNHLIVIKPKKGGLESCKKLIKRLKTKTVNDWINTQIRCRHLTVKVVSNIPL